MKIQTNLTAVNYNIINMQTNRQIHSVFGRYFWYILINSLLRKTSWILGGLCILVGIIFLFVIPSATQLDPFAL
jgi:hypothetical protein